MPVGWADANHIGYPPHRHPGAVPQRHQLAATNEPFRYRLTAASGTRKERPTRIASSSPEWTKRYTVIFDTRMIKATSATVRNRTSLRGVSPAIGCLSARSRALDRILRTSHVRLQGKSRTEKSKTVDSLIVITVWPQSPPGRRKKPRGPSLSCTFPEVL